ncbi:MULTISPECIES: Ldh family oxidoreductase [Cobetia]|uniref:Ldh family oxidoreductase n=1 Tax=Cobetia crustatorum TaxID=553385 RepID=A0A558HMC2_9GAMM|nr:MULTISPECIES: Ldh family oxidoreductase [Cobetia]TVU70201.1 Ldh family oxidoreductase [Cobetia crustatorum]
MSDARRDDAEADVVLNRDELHSICCQVLSRHGFSEPHVAAISEALVAAEMAGSRSHGLYRLMGFVATLGNGGVIPDAEPVVEDTAPSVIKVDARGGFSSYAFRQGVPGLVSKARSSGIAILAINRCVHATALWVEIERLTQEGLVAIACNPTQSYMAPHGGKEPLLGTNPIAFGWPRPEGDPYVFDFATSAIARGDIELHRRQGDEIPLGWGVDRDGAPCQDPGEVLDHGAMLPFGEHKGSALAIMIELIAGPLIGDMLSIESTEYDQGKKSLPYHGELIIAIDPARITGGDSRQHMLRSERLFDMVQQQGARLSSERRYQARQKHEAQGVSLSRALYDDVMKLAS